MSENLASGPASATTDEKPDASADARAAQREQEHPIRKTRHEDKIADAFEKAERQLEARDRPDEPKPRAKAKEPAETKPASKKAEKPEPKDDGDEADEGDDEPDAAPKPAAKPQRLEPKAYWSREKRDGFTYLPREVQERLLEEAPAAVEHWSQELKDSFAKQPREAQEFLLTRSQDMERGYQQKLQSLAGDRKLIEGVRSAPTPQQRALMQQRGMDEAAVFSALLRHQQHSMDDPIGYVRDFITRNRIDPRAILGEGGEVGQQNGQTAPTVQADITSHPAYRALKAEFDALKGTVTSDLQRRSEDHDRQLAAEMDSILAETNDGGDPAYPFTRLLAGTMAEILDGDPERYRSMGTRDRFVEAYNLALESFPELKALHQTAQPKPKPADEPAEDDADADEAAEQERLKRAASKKSRTPQAAPPSDGDKDQRFRKAFGRAEKQLGLR